MIVSLFFLLLVLNFIFENYEHLQPFSTLLFFTRGGILGLSLIYLVKGFFIRRSKPLLFYSIFIFIIMLFFYALNSLQFSKVQSFFFSTTSFYFAFYWAIKGQIKEDSLMKLAYVLLIVYFIETLYGVVTRGTQLYAFYEKADNVGYKSLYLMLIFSLNLKKISNIVAISLLCALIILSFKRGAILIASLAYLLAFIPLLFNGKSGFRKQRKFVAAIFSFFILVFLIGIYKFWDIIVYRFVSDDSGSGRDKIYTWIYEGWLDGNLNQRFFGNGFLEVPNYLNRFYGREIFAHSDWLELLFDHGILGVSLYLIVLLSFLFLSKLIFKSTRRFYPIFLMASLLWIGKSIFSGVYLNKDSVLFFFLIGYIIGNALNERRDQRKISWGQLS